MLVSEVEAKLTSVFKSLSDTPRTAYEVDNLFRLNCERIAAARAGLADLSGDYVDTLRKRCNEAEQQAAAQHAAGVSGTAAVDNAFSLDFAMEEAEEANDAEMAEAKTAVGAGSKRPSKKAGAKSKSGKKGKEGEEKKEKKKSDGAEKRTVANSPEAAGAQPDGKAAASPPPAPSARWTVLDRQDDLASTELPVVLSTSGRGSCEPVTNSPLARLYFTEAMDWDGAACQCAVEVYRCVVLALTYAEPQLSWAECQAAVQAQLAAGVSTGKGTTSKRPAVPAAASGAKGGDEAAQKGEAAREGGEGEYEEGEGEDETEAEASAEDLTLSEQLIAEYEEAQRAEAELDLDTSALPRDVTEKLQQRLRSFSDEVWVVLLCHGGYFAGGVFLRGTCVVHKAFQRYVVRKKQGGKQSSNAKDAGSYNSVGSQIRAAQEVKWRVDVRDILLEWTPYINAASFILYAAPGPQNRAVLTDFSLLPAVAALGGSKGVSPIQLKDRRVSRVPITTHRPNFEEVQRIYKVCSRCSLLYVKDEAAE